MAKLVWDRAGERMYQTGIQNGVLYLRDGNAVVWNGLTSLVESVETELTSYYLDGVKFLENLAPGDFSGKLSAWTYPDEFESLTGVADISYGLQYYEQPPKSFSLSYQTKISNDLDANAGYKIHLLYNLLAQPTDAAYATHSDEIEPIEFVWDLTGTPQKISGFRPTVHVVIDSTKADPEVLEAIENIIYGSDVSSPRFPTIVEIRSLFETIGVLSIIDNGDGTWTAIDNGNEYISMDSPTEFTITGADATYLDATTYTISTTTP